GGHRGRALAVSGRGDHDRLERGRDLRVRDRRGEALVFGGVGCGVAAATVGGGLGGAQHRGAAPSPVPLDSLPRAVDLAHGLMWSSTEGPGHARDPRCGRLPLDSVLAVLSVAVTVAVLAVGSVVSVAVLAVLPVLAVFLLGDRTEDGQVDRRADLVLA